MTCEQVTTMPWHTSVAMSTYSEPLVFGSDYPHECCADGVGLPAQLTPAEADRALRDWDGVG
jgi:hypothetical protein